MATLTVNAVTRSGLNLTDALTAAGVSGDQWANTGTECLVVYNGSGSSITVTLTYTNTFDGASPANKTVAVGAGKMYVVGPFPQEYYNSAAQLAGVTYSSVTSVTVAVVRLG